LFVLNSNNQKSPNPTGVPNSICLGASAKVTGNMNTNQMELGLKAKQAHATAAQKQRRQQRAQWWFGQMRRVVAASLEWKPQKAEG
jgi:hypothetical protein